MILYPQAQLGKVNHELAQRRKEVTNLSTELVRRQLMGTSEDLADEVQRDQNGNDGAAKRRDAGHQLSTKASKTLTLPDLTCFNCGFVLSLTSPTADSCSCSEADEVPSVRAAEEGHENEHGENDTVEESVREAPEVKPLELGAEDRFDDGPRGDTSPADQVTALSLPPPSLTDSGLGKEVDHFLLSHRQTEDNLLLLASPSSLATDKTHEELDFSKASNAGLDYNNASPSDDLFVSFEAVEAKLKDCESEWNRKLDAALNEKNVEMEQLRTKHNNKVEELLKRLDVMQSE